MQEKALSLPLVPGVYIMQNAQNEVIYVGKAKKLKNRVSQYFIDTVSHTPKTRLMVSKVDHFDVILAASEFEALVLECSLIKRYMPKYNILLKDDKGYPYLRLDLREDFPTLTLASKLADDGARYFGPYGGRYLTQKVIDTLRLTFKLPDCPRQFPRDIGKERPCLNFQMGNCDGWCRGAPGQAEYHARMQQVLELLKGNYKQVAADLKQQMLEASEALEFERAAELRDRMNAIEALGQKQLVTAGRMADTDAIGYAQTEAKGCFAVLHYVGGNLVDKDYEIVPVSDSTEEAVSALVKQYYLGRGAAPRQILLPCEMDDAEVFAEYLGEAAEQEGPSARAPARRQQPPGGAGLQERQGGGRAHHHPGGQRRSKTLELAARCWSCREPPRRMESYDISNIAGTDIVASMVVFQDGKPLKSGYRHFKLEGLDDQDDYASMRQVLRRRFTHYLAGDKGFETAPDLLLIDGGIEHAKTVLETLTPMGIDIPIYGMVKDDRHRTRALVTPDGREIGIAAQQSVFALIGNIQEETHRFAIEYQRSLRNEGFASKLDAIPGVGEKRRNDLIKNFKSLKAVREAGLSQLELVVPKNTARAVYDYFHGNKEEEPCASSPEAPEADD